MSLSYPEPRDGKQASSVRRTQDLPGLYFLLLDKKQVGSLCAVSPLQGKPLKEVQVATASWSLVIVMQLFREAFSSPRSFPNVPGVSGFMSSLSPEQ